MIMHTRLHPDRNNQAGVTLLMAIFVMSGLTLIAITIAYLAIRDIRNSRAITLSEPAMAAAQSAGEEGIWNLKRAVSFPKCKDSQNKDSGNLANTNYWSAQSYCKSFGDTTFNLKANSPFTFYLYDPDNINGDTDLRHSNVNDPSQVTPPYYNTLTVTNQSSAFSVNVYTTRLDDSAIGAQPVNVPPGQTRTVNNLSGPQGSDNRIKIKLIYCNGCGGSTADGNVLVTTDAGMPTIPTIDATGCAQKKPGASNVCDAPEFYNRRINITVPQ